MDSFLEWVNRVKQYFLKEEDNTRARYIEMDRRLTSCAMEKCHRLFIVQYDGDFSRRELKKARDWAYENREKEYIDLEKFIFLRELELEEPQYRDYLRVQRWLKKKGYKD